MKKKLLAIAQGLGGLIRKPGAYVAAVVPVAIPFVLAAVAAPPAPKHSQAPMSMASMTALPTLRYSDLVPSPSTLPEHSLFLKIEEGDTLDSVLLDGGLDRAATAALNLEFGKTVDLRRLRPGHVLRFHYDARGVVDAVEMKVLGWGELDAVRNQSNGFDVERHQAVQHEIATTVSAEIDRSLDEAIHGTGEGPQLVQQLVDVFQWDIDFFALHKGDSFSLVVNKKFSGSDPNGYGPIVAARFTSEGQTYEAFRHQSADGRAGYYARNGSPLRKQFLRAPLKFSRITSGFSKSRFHPILHCFRPHHGVDYGAPVGTPVMTTADGVVVAAAYKRGEGNYVRIRHTSRIETNYLHLSRFAKDIRPGHRVTQGDVIGFVGATGLATGPHLDYRVSDGGTWLDPLSLRSITPDPLRGDSLRLFRSNVAAFSPRLSGTATQLAEFAAKRRALF